MLGSNPLKSTMLVGGIGRTIQYRIFIFTIFISIICRTLISGILYSLFIIYMFIICCTLISGVRRLVPIWSLRAAPDVDHKVYVYVYVCVYIYICISIAFSLSLYLSISLYIYIYMTCVYIYIYIYTYDVYMYDRRCPFCSCRSGPFALLSLLFRLY